jgi:Zn-dependent protease/predicted transcriptional regulator
MVSMAPHITLGRVFGITIGLHVSWFIIALLITVSLAGHFASINPDWSPVTVGLTALLTGLLFFVSILVHEMAHALVARARGVPVRSITLFALGGVANIEQDVGDARTEFWMGIAGPLMSVAVGLLCLALVSALGGFRQDELTPPSPPMAVFAWLGYINLLLAGFNMIPGFPLDGGRVLRAALWGLTNDRRRATRIAVRVGQVFAVLFITYGLLTFVFGRDFGGLWMAVIGWFLFDAAGASLVQTEVFSGLQGLRVRDVLAEDCTRVPPDLSIETLADDYVLRSGRRCFVVQDEGRVVGLLTASDLQHIDRDRWRSSTVREAMRPLGRLKTVRPDTPVVDALKIMAQEDLNQLPVISNGHLEGVLTRSDVVRLLEARADLSM